MCSCQGINNSNSNRELDTLQKLGVTRTKFLTVSANKPGANFNLGQAIGQGLCKAVKLHVNAYTRNANTLLVATNFYIYYGDPLAQEHELTVVNNSGNVNTRDSELIICSDLNQVWIRIPPVGAYPAIVTVIAIVYE